MRCRLHTFMHFCFAISIEMLGRESDVSLVKVSRLLLQPALLKISYKVVSGFLYHSRPYCFVSNDKQWKRIKACFVDLKKRV